MLRSATILLAAALLAAPIWAAEPETKKGDDPSQPARLSQAELNKKLAADLTNVKLIGAFTVTGKENEAPKEEEYTITSALKLDEEDLWLLKTRIKYGETDKTVPIPLEIKWAGDTPVITLTNLEIPGLGTFTSRVVIYEGRYAGTWQHGDVGGHLFGRIEKLAKEPGKEASGDEDPGKEKPAR
jgi:hypothetical protein